MGWTAAPPVAPTCPYSLRGIELLETKLVWAMVRRACRKHLEDFGPQSLLVHRKQPFTREILHEIIHAEGRHGGLDLDDSATRATFRAFAALLRQTGMRKSEATTWLRRSSVKWSLRGTVYVDPPAELLRSPWIGDFAIVVPPPSKADPFGEVWGALPIYLHYAPADADSAFCWLSHLELTVPVSGATHRLSTPFLARPGAAAITASQLDTALRSILTRTPTVGAASAGLYSWHSARIYLACALLASGASTAQIQALCRWQTEESLRIYARLNPEAYRALLRRAASADVTSVSTAALPELDSVQQIHDLLGVSLQQATVEVDGEETRTAA